MLILSRKKGDGIVIGDDIVITVHDLSADSVKLSIQAPRDVKVLRGELARAAKENQLAAMEGSQSGLGALEEYLKGKDRR